MQVLKFGNLSNNCLTQYLFLHVTQAGEEGEEMRVYVRSCLVSLCNFLNYMCLYVLSMLVHNIDTTRVQARGGAEAPPDFKLMLSCVQAVTAKGCPKFRKAREEKQVVCNKLNARG